MAPVPSEGVTYVTVADPYDEVAMLRRDFNALEQQENHSDANDIDGWSNDIDGPFRDIDLGAYFDAE